MSLTSSIIRAQTPFMNRPRPDNNYQAAHAALLLESFQRLVGRPLIDAAATPEDTARTLFYAPLIVVSHGAEADPILNYGNAVALKLWETDWDAFTKTPSRHTAEPMLREARDRLFDKVNTNGFADNYEGIRITTSGKRFKIKDGIIWSLIDGDGKPFGHAATFEMPEFLP